MRALNSSKAKNKAVESNSFTNPSKKAALRIRIEGEEDGEERMRGVVAQCYHRADNSATATRDPALSPADCGSDFPKLSSQRPAVSVHCP